MQLFSFNWNYYLCWNRAKTDQTDNVVFENGQLISLTYCVIELSYKMNLHAIIRENSTLAHVTLLNYIFITHKNKNSYRVIHILNYGGIFMNFGGIYGHYENLRMKILINLITNIYTYII